MAKKKSTSLNRALKNGAILLIWFIIWRYFRIGLTRGTSMLPTFKHNQPLLLHYKIYRRRKPKRFDIIAFRCTTNKKKVYLKRVIGLPGEAIRIENGDVYINDELLDEAYLKEPMKQSPKIEIVVKAETLFVMGDNRNNSLDSRREVIGLVPIKNVIGVVKSWK